MEYRILGPLEVVEEGHPLALAAGKQRALLAILLLRANEVVSSDELIDGLWGERAPATATKSIQIYVSQLRKALGDSRSPDSGSAVLVTKGHGYELRVEPGELDLHRFDGLVVEGKQALATDQPADAAAKLREALSLWRGQPLADFTYEPFAQPEIARLEEVRLNALEDRIDADLALGRHADLIGELEGLLKQHPLRERLRGQLMLALYRSGRQAEALDVYQQTRRLLRDELGLEPSPSLQELEKGILNQEPALAGPTPTTAKSARRHSRTLILVGAVLLIGAIAAGLIELTSDSGPGGLPGVQPNAVGQINAKTNRIVAQVGVGTRPSRIVYGNGALWVENDGDNTISRVDPVARQQIRTIPLGAVPSDLAVGMDGIWVTTDKGIKVIDAAFNEPTRTIRVRAPRPTTEMPFELSPTGIAFTHRAAWVINGDFLGRLVRVDGKTGHARDTITTGNAPAAIASDGDDLWVSDVFDDTVSRLDRTGAVTAKTSVGHAPTGIAVGYGAVWVVNTDGDEVTRIDRTNATVDTTIDVGRSPSAIAIGGGAVWVANKYGGTVSRIDPRSKKVVATIEVGGSPVGLAFAHGSLWVSVQEKAPAVSGKLEKEGGVLQVDWDAPAIDPATQATFLVFAAQIEYATCAKLLNYPDKPAPAGLELQPEVAASMPSVSPDRRTFTFTIRRGYRFSPPSNELVTAATFKHTIERTLNPKVKAVVPYVTDIVGERAFLAGKARHISGVSARGNKLSIRLTHAAEDFPARIAMPFFCAVPLNTPMHPTKTPIPMAGPYYIASQIPGVQLVLKRNPNYSGPRPRRLAEIVYTSSLNRSQAITRVIAAEADYALSVEGAPSRVRLNRRYGANSPAARHGRQQVFINPWPAVNALTLNAGRPLFADGRVRRAVNYAIDRKALADAGGFNGAGPLTAIPTDQYVPPGFPGVKDVEIYPSGGDLQKARRLAGNRKRTAVMYTCDFAPCAQEAQIVRRDLAKIGISVDVRAFPISDVFEREAKRNEPYDIGLQTWRMDYADPFDVLNRMFDGSLGANGGQFDDPVWNRRLQAAARLSGERRYRAYARLGVHLARKAAPWAAFEYETRFDFFSSRIGCQTYEPIYGMDLAALCVRRVKNQR